MTPPLDTRQPVRDDSYKKMDWWQAILVLLAGGLISGVTAYATHRWTTSASREGEERQAKRRLEEEQRQAIRQLRRERMQPVLDFLEIAKQSVASRFVEQIIDEQYESLGPERKLPPEEWRKIKSDLLEAEPGTGVKQMRAFMLAMHASVSMRALQVELVRLYAAPAKADAPDAWRQFQDALQSAERAIEQYVAGAEPHESSSDEPSQET